MKCDVSHVSVCNCWQVSVEGNIGCGKSTLLGHFQKFTSSVEVSVALSQIAY